MSFPAIEMTHKAVIIDDKIFTIVDTGFRSLSHAVYLAHSVEYCLTDNKSDLDDPVQLASVTGKVIYAHDSIMSETVRYGHTIGVGCIFVYKDTSDKWWIIAAMNDQTELITTFGAHSDITRFFDMRLSDDL